MRSKYIFSTVGIVFLILAAAEFHYDRTLGAALNAITGAIFLYLGKVSPKIR